MTKKGKLWGSIFYVMGPIDRVSEKDATDWRNHITDFLNSLGIIVMDPCKKEEWLDSALSEIESKEYRNNLKRIGQYKQLKDEVNEEIRHPDLRAVDKSDAVIAYLDFDVVMAGTFEEFFWANRCKKPILIVCPQGKQNVPDWIIGAVNPDEIFSNFNDLREYLIFINNPENLIQSSRWVFIKYDNLLKQIGVK